MTRTEHYESSTDYCLKAIHWCIDEELLWGLGESYYQIGFNYELMEEFEQALPYFQKALLMFELRKNTLYSSFLQEKLKKLQSEI
ncbi:tetratricopeptide repeat protein [Rossellomorea vietnamensis]|uniref:tetratricopeptide repeat protein n=1 Tax=Rossellomorea vietnamensis TaxID=218284 RepID=UPI003D2DB9A8